MILTQLIFAEAIEHQTLAEFIRLAADDDGYAVLLREHGHHSGTRPRVHSSIGVQGVRAEEDLGSSLARIPGAI